MAVSLAYLPWHTDELKRVDRNLRIDGTMYRDLKRVPGAPVVRTAFARCAPLTSGDHRPIPFLRFWLGGEPGSVGTVASNASPMGRMLLVPRRAWTTRRVYNQRARTLPTRPRATGDLPQPVVAGARRAGLRPAAGAGGPVAAAQRGQPVGEPRPAGSRPRAARPGCRAGRGRGRGRRARAGRRRARRTRDGRCAARRSAARRAASALRAGCRAAAAAAAATARRAATARGRRRRRGSSGPGRTFQSEPRPDRAGRGTPGPRISSGTRIDGS